MKTTTQKVGKLLAFCGLLLWGFSVIAPAAHSQEIDWGKYCSDNARNILLFVDITTPYDAQDKAVLVEGLQRIVANLEGGDRIIIRTIADSATSSERLIDKCIPWCPDKGFWEDLLSSCTGGLILNHKRLLVAEIREKARAKLDSFRELEHSDVVTTIALATNEELSGDKKTALYVFSDLIENSVFMPGKEFFLSENSALLEKVKANRLMPRLPGADVKVFGVGRGGTAERASLPVERLNKLLDFWKQLFLEAGATNVTINQNLVAQ